MPDNDDGEDDGIDAIADALDQAKRAGEFAHWRAAKTKEKNEKNALCGQGSTNSSNDCS